MTQDEVLAWHSYFVRLQLWDNFRELPNCPSSDEEAPASSAVFDIEDSALNSFAEVIGGEGSEPFWSPL